MSGPGTDEDPQGQERDLIDMLSVIPIGGDVFRAEAPEWDGDRVFGGVILGQATSAAVSTIEGRRAHSLHGYFLRPVRVDQPLEFRVERVRDGRSFSTRQVSTLQEGKTVFSMMCSFHEDTEGDDYQLPIAADVPDPDEHLQGEGPDPLHIFDIGYTAPDPEGFHRSTGRAWMRTAAPVADDPRIHAVLLSYLSDVTRTAARPPSRGEVEDIEGLISLDHAVWFHRPVRPDEWLLFDVQVLIHARGRGLIRGTMHTRDGRLGVSMAQEMLITPLSRLSRLRD